MLVWAQRPAVNCRGTMSFTLANTGVLHLAGTSITTPTTYGSVGTFLSAGIPQSADKTVFVDDAELTNFHRIKHAICYLISTAGGTTGKGAARHNAGCNYNPSSTTGTRVAIGDQVEMWNSRDQIFNFALINLSGGNMELDVEVYE